jgi:hypothetical protein
VASSAPGHTPPERTRERSRLVRQAANTRTHSPAAPAGAAPKGLLIGIPDVLRTHGLEYVDGRDGPSLTGGDNFPKALYGERRSQARAKCMDHDEQFVLNLTSLDFTFGFFLLVYPRFS